MVWTITIILAFLIFRSAMKIDYKHNDGWVMADFDEWFWVALAFLILVIPIVNVFCSIVMWVVVFYQRLDKNKSFSAEDFFYKILFIKRNKN